MRVTYDSQDEKPPAADGWQPSLFGGPGAESVLRQAPLFEGGLDRVQRRPDETRTDQPDLFKE